MFTPLMPEAHFSLYKPAHFNSNHRSASPQFFRVRLNCLNCQPSNVYAFHHLHRHRCTRCYSRYEKSLEYIFEPDHEPIVPVKGGMCGIHAVTMRCTIQGEAPVNRNWEITNNCMTRLKITEHCFCMNVFRIHLGFYAVVTDDQKGAFEHCCKTTYGRHSGVSVTSASC
jgi:hypothetical protein